MHDENDFMEILHIYRNNIELLIRTRIYDDLFGDNTIINLKDNYNKDIINFEESFIGFMKSLYEFTPKE